MKKRATVVRLLHITNDAKTWGNILTSTFGKPQHLYIIDNSEIKEGDWWLNKSNNTIYTGDEDMCSRANTNSNCKKIIATTNPKLHSTRLKACPINPEDNMVSIRGVSKPPKSFIEEYCRVGGIDEVDVEYGLFHDGNFKHGFETHAFKSIRKPRVNSNNEIIIHPIKDSWTREEVLKIIKDFAYCLYEKHGHPDPADTAIWIKENL